MAKKYLDSEGLKTYTKEIKTYIEGKVNGIDTSLYKVVSALPTQISQIEANKIYLLASTKQGAQNRYSEYVYTGSLSSGASYNTTNWEKLGEYDGNMEKEVLPFDAMATASITVQAGSVSASNISKIVYSTSNNTFVCLAKDDNKYYGGWEDTSNRPLRAWYGDTAANSLKGVVPVKGKVYTCGNAAYVYNGTTLMQLGKEYSNATPTAAGLMSAADKKALDLVKSDMATMKSNMTDVSAKVDQVSEAMEATQAEIEDINDTLGSGSLYDVAYFDEFIVTTPTVSNSSAASPDAICYSSGLKTFVARKGSTYYSNWSGADRFGKGEINGKTPKKDTAYIKQGELWKWNGTALQSMLATDPETISTSEISAMFK